jgi:hypothetical protein
MCGRLLYCLIVQTTSFSSLHPLSAICLFFVESFRSEFGLFMEFGVRIQTGTGTLVRLACMIMIRLADQMQIRIILGNL